MNEQTIQKVIDAIDKCTMQACIVCPYNGRNACKYEMHKDAYEALTYLDRLRGKALETISSMKEDIEEWENSRKRPGGEEDSGRGCRYDRKRLNRPVDSHDHIRRMF